MFENKTGFPGVILVVLTFKTQKMEKREVEKLLLAATGRLYKFAYKLTHDYDRANDLLQETFLRVLYNAEKFKDDGKFMSWAFVIMRHAFLNNCKHEEQYIAAEESLYSTAFTTNDESASGTEVEDFYCAIDELPGNAGKVMRLLISGHKYVEIAVRMEIPIGTVKTRINISRSILKQRLKDYLN